MHVPTGLSLGRMQMRWLRRITGRPYVKGALHTPRIGGTGPDTTQISQQWSAIWSNVRPQLQRRRTAFGGPSPAAP